MWLFTKHGHISLAQHEGDPESLRVLAQMREDIDHFVALLDAAGDHTHDVQELLDGGYRFCTKTKKTVAAQAVSSLVKDIDYTRFLHSAHFDFGQEPGYLLWLNPTGLQVARVKPE